MNISTMQHYAYILIGLAVIAVLGSFYWKHMAWVKLQVANVKRHWKLFTFTTIVTVALIYTFNANYTFQNPVVPRTQESYTDVWNGRAVCDQDLAAAQQARDTANSDLYK
jgi:hypothetical protein